MILTFDSLNKYRIYSVDNTLVKNFHIVKFVIGIWLAIFRSVDNCVFFIPHIRRLQGCVFDDSISLKEKDRVKVGDNMYNVESIKPYPSYRLVIIERVK